MKQHAAHFCADPRLALISGRMYRYAKKQRMPAREQSHCEVRNEGVEATGRQRVLVLSGSRRRIARRCDMRRVIHAAVSVRMAAVSWKQRHESGVLATLARLGSVVAALGVADLPYR